MKIKLVDENLVGQPGLCPFIDPKTNWVRDIDEYDVAIYVDRMCFIQPINPEKTNYAWIIEPPIINGENYINIVKNINAKCKIFYYGENLTRYNSYNNEQLLIDTFDLIVGFKKPGRNFIAFSIVSVER